MLSCKGLKNQYADEIFFNDIGALIEQETDF